MTQTESNNNLAEKSLLPESTKQNEDSPTYKAQEKLKNRWLIAASAVGIHIAIGSVYAYSVWILPLNILLGWTRVDIVMAFSVAILLLGFSAALFGKMVENIGPRKSGTITAIFYSLGTIGSGIALSFASLPLFIFFYGVVGGIGLGFGYITPVGSLVKWFPDKRGLATGIAIMGFGFSSMIFGPIIAKLCEIMNPIHVFYLLGVFFFLLIFISAQYLSPPPISWQLEQDKKMSLKAKSKTKKNQHPPTQLGVREARKTRRFYYVWIMMFINISCGIAIIAVASPMAQEIIGLSTLESASLVGIMGLFNGLGRIGWASVSDYIGRSNTFILFFLIEIVAFIMLTIVKSPFEFQLLLIIIMSCYGGAFASLPAFLSDMFGTKELSAIHGSELTAWALAGVVGPILVSALLEYTGNYNATLYIFSTSFVVALVVSILLAFDLKKLARESLVK